MSWVPYKMISSSQSVHGFEQSNKDYSILSPIRGMTYLRYWDEFPMMSALMCVVTHWTRLTMNHDVRSSVVMIHQTTLPHRLLT